MKTFKRIEKLKEAVLFVNKKQNLIIADIATDHGYLAESLSKEPCIKKIIVI